LLLLALVAFTFWYGMRFAGVRSKKNGEVTIIEKAELEAGPPLSKEEKNWRGRELVSWKGDRLWSLLVLGTRQGWEVWTFQWYNSQSHMGMFS
jgi:hypothetical protein